jgi:hypothetical protein
MQCVSNNVVVQFRARKIEKGLSSLAVLARDFTRAFFCRRVKFMVYARTPSGPLFDRMSCVS